uniref:Putative secreted salivary peptide of 6.78 kDa n=1 Tax=Ixodes ricinus TaxID=34613 RepID=V5H293_IXORI
MNLLIMCIVIANVVISQGNVNEAGKTYSQIQEQSLLVYDRRECRYLGYKMNNGEVKSTAKSLCQMDLPRPIRLSC